MLSRKPTRTELRFVDLDEELRQGKTSGSDDSSGDASREEGFEDPNQRRKELSKQERIYGQRRS